MQSTTTFVTSKVCNFERTTTQNLNYLMMENKTARTQWESKLTLHFEKPVHYKKETTVSC